MKEKWAKVTSWPAYQVSNIGRVRRIVAPPRGAACLFKHPRILPPYFHKGYQYICLAENGKRKCVAVHVLVCTAFHGFRPTPGHQVAHTDGSRQNNNYRNLRWATSKENHGDRINHGTLPRGEKSNSAKMNNHSIRLIRKIYEAKIANQREIGEAFGITQAQVSHIVLRQHWTELT